jgi:hypothetical protein
MTQNKIMYKVLLAVAFCTLSCNIVAQQGLGLWSEVSVEKKISKKLAANLNLQTRHTAGLAYLQTYFAELGLGYKLHKNLELSIYYRNINRRKNESSSFKKRQRYYANLAYETKFGNIKVENRLRYQRQFKDNDGSYELDADYLRYKLGVAYNSKSKFTPYISADVFYQISAKLDQIRPKIGLAYKLSKHHAIDASVFKNVDLLNKQAEGLILGINYKFKF